MCVAAARARKQEIAALYPEFEVGAMPPFGMMHGHRVFVERCFVGEPELVFNAGTHTDSLCMHYGDFADIVHPTVGTFGVPPGTTWRDVSAGVSPSSSQHDGNSRGLHDRWGLYEHLRRVGIAVCLLLVAAATGWAQDGVITGRVTDPSGGALPGVDVSLTSPALLGGRVGGQ